MDPVYEEEDLGGNGEEEPPVGATGVLDLGLQGIHHHNPCGGNTSAKGCAR